MSSPAYADVSGIQMRGKRTCILTRGILEAAPLFLIRSIVRNTYVPRRLRWQPGVPEGGHFAARVPPGACAVPCRSRGLALACLRKACAQHIMACEGCEMVHN